MDEAGRSMHVGNVPWPPILYLGAIALGFALGWWIPLPWFANMAADILFPVGLLVVVGGFFLIFAAIRTMRRVSTNIQPTRGADHLVTSGPFAITRNPIYLGNTAVVLGLAPMFSNAWFVVSAIAAAIATQVLQIRREESHLEVRFGKRWRDYRKKVRRWI